MMEPSLIWAEFPPRIRLLPIEAKLLAGVDLILDENGFAFLILNMVCWVEKGIQWVLNQSTMIKCTELYWAVDSL